MNVYAHALMLEKGEVKYLHYGLFLKPGTSASAAQRYSSQLVLERLPSLPCRILEVGIGLASTLVELKQLGYEITGITPDPAQVQYAMGHFGADIPVVCTRLEDFSAPAESFDVLLFQESAQYISPLDIFTKAAEFLAPGGEMLILDEFALKRTEPGRENLHLLKHFIALAGRFGFEVVEQLDLSSMAAPTLGYLLAGVNKHRAKLTEDLGLSPSLLDELNLSNQAYQEKYATGRFGYVLLRLKKITVPKWKLGELDESCNEEMRLLFSEVFGHEMSRELWYWKYGERRGQEIGLWREGKLVAHYGGVTRQVLMFGKCIEVCQICDVMVRETERGVLTRKGPFSLIMAGYSERYCGFGTQHLIGYGFPNERAMRLAEKLGQYAEVGNMVEIAWPPLIKKPRFLLKLRPITPLDPQFEKIIDTLWDRMRKDYQDGIIGVRNSNYLVHRYFNHPEREYKVYLVANRLTGNPYGVMVLRLEGEFCELLDLIAPVSHFQLLIEYARRIAASYLATKLYCWITANYSGLLLHAGGKVTNLDIRIPSNVWTDGPPPEMLNGRWWLMSGDTDFR